MTKKCINCASFNNENHKNDDRTKHAGICDKYKEIVYISETCKLFESKEIDVNEIEVIEPIFMVPKQLNIWDFLG